MDNDELDAMDVARWLSLGDGARELGEGSQTIPL